MTEYEAMRERVITYMRDRPDCLVRDIERDTGILGHKLHQLLGTLARSGVAIYTHGKLKKWRLM